MKISNPSRLLKKDVIVFDLDGTIAPSKSAMDKGMAGLIGQLAERKVVAVISGGNMKQYKLELLDPLKGKKINWQNLLLFPTCSTVFYRHTQGRWKQIYAHFLTKAEVQKIKSAFNKTFIQMAYHHPKKTYGPVIEDRKTQISFSALGQDVVTVLGKKGVALKKDWMAHHDVRPQMLKHLKPLLRGLEVRSGGLTTIDVTHKGIDKAYGVRQISKQLKIPISKMLFVGDAIYPGGNDQAALKTGIDHVKVKDPEDTKQLIKKLLK